jgi:hypothetical protein
MGLAQLTRREFENQLPRSG